MILKLREILEIKKADIQESKDKNILFRILTPFIRTEIFNKNNRLYPEDVTAKAIANFGEKIKNSKNLSQVNHPLGTVHPDMDKISHIIDDIRYDQKDKRGYVTLNVLNTSSGRDLKTIVDAGAKLGVSLRGKGTIGDDKKVQSDFEIFGVDVVSSPSFGDDATFTKANVFESYNPEDEKKITVEEFTKQVTIGLGAAFRVDEQAEDLSKFEDENTERMIEIVKNRYTANGADLSLIFEKEEKEEDKDLREQQRLSALYKDAQRSGYKKSIKEYKKEFSDVITERK